MTERRHRVVRAATHLHTRHSWDSRMRPRALATRLHRSGVTVALVTDHDSFGGALEMRRISDGEGLGLRVPVAAEVRTDCGDVIVAFDDEDAPDLGALKHWARLPGEVRAHGGLVWLPHPYRHHDRIEELAAEADVVEVFNARCTLDENLRAAELCERHGKTQGYGADAHLLREAGTWSVEYDSATRLVELLSRQPLVCPTPRLTRTSNICMAEVINGVKRRRPTLVGFFALRYAWSRSLEAVGRG